MRRTTLVLLVSLAVAAAGCGGSSPAPYRAGARTSPAAPTAGVGTARRLHAELRRGYGGIRGAKAFWYDDVKKISYDPRTRTATVATGLFTESEAASPAAAICRAVIRSGVRGVHSALVVDDDGQPLQECGA